ncbi:MAG: GNAT family N-acetyltransferase [Deinococcales bacterium]
MSNLVIRAFSQEDYPAFLALSNGIYRHQQQSQLELEKNDDNYQGDYVLRRFSAYQEDKFVGAFEFRHLLGMFHPQKFHLSLMVGEIHRQQGIGTKLYEAALKELRSFNPISLRVQVAEEDSSSLNFAQNRDFSITKKDFLSYLELKTFEITPFLPLIHKVEAQSIQLKSLADLGDHEGIRRQYHHLWSQVRLDVPRSEPASPISYEDFVRFVYSDMGYLSQGTWVAIQEGTWLGLSQFFLRDRDGDLDMGLTGVLASARNKGIASALKLKGIMTAKAIEAKRIYTDNDSRNQPMLSINDKLGFVRQPAWVSMTKVFHYS